MNSFDASGAGFDRPNCRRFFVFATKGRRFLSRLETAPAKPAIKSGRATPEARCLLQGFTG
jgi:hypothetical protein